MNFFNQRGQGSAFASLSGFVSNQQQQFNTGFDGFNNQPFGQNTGFNQSLGQVPSENSSNIHGNNNKPQKQSNQPEAFDDFQTAKSVTPIVNWFKIQLRLI